MLSNMNLAALTRALPERLASEYRALALSERAGACVILLQNTTWGTVARLVRRRSELESQPRHWTQKEDLTVYTPRYSCTYLLRLRPETEDQGYTRDHFLSQNIRIPSPNPDQTHPLRGALDHKPPRLLTPEGWERETLRARIVGQNSFKSCYLAFSFCKKKESHEEGCREDGWLCSAHGFPACCLGVPLPPESPLLHSRPSRPDSTSRSFTCG